MFKGLSPRFRTPGPPLFAVALAVLGLVPAGRAEPPAGCALETALTAQRPALTERLRSDRAFRNDDRDADRGANFAAWSKAVDRALKEAGDAAALQDWQRFRALTPAARATDPVFAGVVAEYALLRYGPDLQAALTALVACRTLGATTDSAAAFSRARTVIDSVASAHGFAAETTQQGRALTLTLGAGAPVATFWGYLDVPPPGSGWSGDPWLCAYSDTAWVGRGTAEGKGPALAALFGLRAAWDVAPTQSSAARLVLRLDALSTRTPITTTEAGPHVFLGGSATPAGLSQRARLTFRIATKAEQMEIRPQMCNIAVGEIRTEVPGDRVATSVAVDLTVVGLNVSLSARALTNHFKDFSAENSYSRLNLRRDGGQFHLVATGRPAPGAMPELGQNPLIDLAMFLQYAWDFCPSPAALTTLFLAENVAYERNGRGLGVSRKTEAGVGTTLTVTDLGAVGDSAWAEFEVYHPDIQTEEEMLGKIRERLAIFNNRYGAALKASVVARTPAAAPAGPAAASRLAAWTADCASQATPPPRASEWPGRWNLPGAIPLGSLSPPDRPNNLTNERTQPALVVTWIRRVVRVLAP